MVNKYSNLKLSQWLKERGFEKEYEFTWQSIRNGDNYRLETKGMVEQNQNHFYGMGYPAYDILNDLCVRYCKEIWGVEPLRKPIPKDARFVENIPQEDNYSYQNMEAWEYHSEQVFKMCQNKATPEEIENYFMQYSILNNK